MYLYIVKWKEHISRFVLRNYKENRRSRKGCSLQNAQSVGILYKERDHDFYRNIKEIAKNFQDQFGVKRVAMLSFVDKDLKQSPSWLVKKLDSGFFCKSDLNWYGKPVKEIEAFTEVEFDILFDLELEPILPLKHVLYMSLAKMKVGAEQVNWTFKDYDVQICRVDHKPNDEGVMPNEMEIWQEQIKRTFKFLSEANIN